MSNPWLSMVAALGLASVTAPAPAQTPDAFTTAAHLHRGVNVLGYDRLWSDPAKARWKPRYFPMLRAAGFDFVRVVLQAFDHMDANNRLDPRWLKTLDGVVRDARAAGLSVILDEHDFNGCSDDPPACAPRLLAFWDQVGHRYADQPDTVLFELLNEPHGALDAAAWNGLLTRLIPAVRATNPRRTLVIGPTHWNSLSELPSLRLPAGDRNILVTFHYYEPFRFTHQGASWVPAFTPLHGVPFTAEDEKRIGLDFNKAAAWAKAENRPLLLGEFGAYDGSGTPVADRARYAGAVRRAAEARNIPWAYWQFDSSFNLYDSDADHWIEPIRADLTGR